MIWSFEITAEGQLINMLKIGEMRYGHGGHEGMNMLMWIGTGWCDLELVTTGYEKHEEAITATRADLHRKNGHFTRNIRHGIFFSE